MVEINNYVSKRYQVTFNTQQNSFRQNKLKNID